MYNLATTPILTAWQKDLLSRFFATPISHGFYLTGGTALSAFYFAHRESKDFDLFSSGSFDMQRILSTWNEIAGSVGAIISEKVSTQTYKELYITQKTGSMQRIDIVREQPVHFGEVAVIDGISVDSIENIGSNKITAIFNRLEPKDYIDLYYITHETPWTFEQLFPFAQKKDLGLDPFLFAYSLSNVAKIDVWPVLRKPIEPKEIQQYFEDLSRTVLTAIKPH
ncbi:MAG: nucleotidyl transferase AbiEii/AbiGii toxin family protein [bacterium]